MQGALDTGEVRSERNMANSGSRLLENRLGIQEPLLGETRGGTGVWEGGQGRPQCSEALACDMS